MFASSSAAEELREHLPEVLVDDLESLLDKTPPLTRR